MILRVTVWSAI